MELSEIVGWVIYGLLFFGLMRLALRRDREPTGLERLNYRR